MEISILQDKQPFLRGAEFFNPAKLSDENAEGDFDAEWISVRSELVGLLDSFFSEQGTGDSGDYVVQDWPSKSRKEGTGNRCIEMTFIDDVFLNAELFSRIVGFLKGLSCSYRLTVLRDVPDDECGGMIFFYADHAEVWCERGSLRDQMVSLLSNADKEPGS